jgi:hypothetical protein
MATGPFKHVFWYNHYYRCSHTHSYTFVRKRFNRKGNTMMKPGRSRKRLSLAGKKQRPISPLAFIGLGVTMLIVLSASAIFVIPRLMSHAAGLNMNCTLVVPANPLTATGLSTPYQLFAPDAAANGACNEANVNQSTFVQGVIFDPATGNMSVYSPLVIDQGTQPAVAPTVPTLPAHAVVALWFGFNGTLLTLQGANRNALRQGRCVNGLRGSVFGQYAYCNAPTFFNAANRAIAAGAVQVPALGTTTNGLPCPTVRSFGVVDMDQSDNVQTQYLVTANGQTAQRSAANQAQLQNTTVLGNPSDNALVSRVLDAALGCHPWQVPNLADNNTPASALPLDELQAAAFQQAPIGEIPAGDEMVLLNNNPSLAKVNAYRLGVDQTPASTLNANAGNPLRSANNTVYCQNIINTGIPILQQETGLTQNAASPMPAVANSLFTFLAQRLNATLGAGGLNCVGLLNIQNPATLTMDGNGLVTDATLTATPAAANGGGTNGGGTGTGGGTTPATPTVVATAPTTTPTIAATTPTATTANSATGTVTINLTRRVNADVALNITVANQPNQQISVNIAAGSCTAAPAFMQPEDTDANGQNTADAVINGDMLQQLNALHTLPNNLFVTVSQNGTTLGCGIVKVANDTTGTATLGVIQ